MSKIKVLVVPSDKTGVGNFRSLKPHLHLEKMYPEEFFVDIDYNPEWDNMEYLGQYDIIHYHKKVGGTYHAIEATIERLNDCGIVTILDLDDYWEPNQAHPMYQAVVHQKPMILSNIRHATNITTTTDVFAEEIRKINPNVTVLENAIDPNEKQYRAETNPSDRIRIGWLGGSSHLGDIKLLNGMVSKLKSDKLLDKIQFVLCGFDTRGERSFYNEKTGQFESREIHPMETVWYQYEKIFTNDYKSVSPEYKKHLINFKQDEFEGVENEAYRRVWTKPISNYATNYSLFDISLAPLENNQFNAMKSQLKVIEAGFYKKALIAQDFGPYKIDLNNAVLKGGGINPKANAMLVDTAKNHKEWYKHIKKLVQNPELIETLGQNLYDTVNDKYSLDAITEKRRNLYIDLVNNK